MPAIGSREQPLLDVRGGLLAHDYDPSGNAGAAGGDDFQLGYGGGGAAAAPEDNHKYGEGEEEQQDEPERAGGKKSKHH